MEDPDIILYLVPAPSGVHGLAHKTIYLPENASRFVEGKSRLAIKRNHDQHTNGHTAAPVGAYWLAESDRLALRFSQIPRTTQGIIAGRGPEVDLALPDRRGVSKNQFILTFNEQNKPIVKDCGTLSGLKVIHADKPQQYLVNSTWLLQGPDWFSTPPILAVMEQLRFIVLLPNHDYKSAEYVQRVSRFRQGTARPESLMSAASIACASVTELDDDHETPGNSTSSIFIEDEYATGSTSKVFRLWNARTGETRIRKEPLDREDSSDWQKWKRAVRTMSRLKHDHIVAFLNFEHSPWPQIEFEYIPGGSLEQPQCFSLSDREIAQILSQLCSALRHLQEDFNPPIAHRNIQPAKILVASQDHKNIYVKLADFGLAADRDLDSPDKTLLYCAPEVFESEPYDHWSDLWSLGVVIASRLVGLPPFDEDEWRGTPFRVLAHLESEEQIAPNDILTFVFEYLLLIDAKDRSMIGHCDDHARSLLEDLKSQEE